MVNQPRDAKLLFTKMDKGDQEQEQKGAEVAQW